MESPRKRRLFRFCVTVLVVAFAFVAVLVYNAWRMPTRQTEESFEKPDAIDREVVAKRLTEILTPLTIAVRDADQLDTKPFEELHTLFERSFPLTHEQLTRERLGDPPISLLYTWKGSDPSLPAVLLMSHLDVVPIDPATRELWQKSPETPEFDGTFVWGRGALDVKSGAAAMFEAVELLLTKNFVPERTVYLAMGHDEEVGGRNGNRVIAHTLQQRGVRLQFVLDEGGAILDGVIGGIAKPVAFVAVAEKGAALMTITAHGSGGHGSMQSDQSAISRLVRALRRIETNPMPADLDQGTNLLLEFLGPEMSFFSRLVVANRWCCEPLIVARFASAKTTNAVIRSTTSFTGLESGFVANGVPQRATARIDVRMLPTDRTEDIRKRIEQLVDDPSVVVRQSEDDRGVVVEIEAGLGRNSTISAIDSKPFQILQRTIHQVHNDCVVAAGLTAVATDSRHYADLTDNTFRFIPLRMNSEDLQRVHGVNERIAADNYVEIIQFFAQLIRNVE
jgi:carboxypeptidase PM20D1